MTRDLLERIGWNFAQIVGRITLDQNQGAILIGAYTLAAIAFLGLICVVVYTSRKTPEVKQDVVNLDDTQYVEEFLSEKASEFITLANQIERGDIAVFNHWGKRVNCESLVTQSRDLAAWLTTSANKFRSLQGLVDDEQA